MERKHTNREGIEQMLRVYLLVLICIFVVVITLVFICLGTPILYGKLLSYNLYENIGGFGDSAGITAAIFAGLAFAIMCYTLRVQIQNDKQLKKGNYVAQFESSFFSMLELLEQVVSELHIMGNDNKTYVGRDVFTYIYYQKKYEEDDEIYFGLKRYVARTGNYTLQDDAWRHFFWGPLDHYFCSLYRIFKYIDQSPLIDDNQRSQYADIVRAHLSKDEQLLLFFNCINMDNGKFKKLIEKYTLFDNIRYWELPNDRHYYNIYNNFFNDPSFAAADEDKENIYAKEAFIEKDEKKAKNYRPPVLYKSLAILSILYLILIAMFLCYINRNSWLKIPIQSQKEDAIIIQVHDSAYKTRLDSIYVKEKRIILHQDSIIKLLQPKQEEPKCNQPKKATTTKTTKKATKKQPLYLPLDTITCDGKEYMIVEKVK